MLFIGLTLINRVLEGAFINAADVSVLNDTLIFRPANLFGMFNIPVLNLSYFTSGIPHLLKWDYSFFGGNAAILSYLMYSFTAMVGFLLFIIIIGLAYQALSSRVR